MSAQERNADDLFHDKLHAFELNNGETKLAFHFALQVISFLILVLIQKSKSFLFSVLFVVPTPPIP